MNKRACFCPQLADPADLDQLAASTLILTSVPEQLTPENVTTAAQIANQLLKLSNATKVQKKRKTKEATNKKLGH